MKDLKKEFAFAYVNTEDAEQFHLFKEYNVEGFPTLFLLNSSGRKFQVSNNLMFQENSKKLLKTEFENFKQSKMTDDEKAALAPANGDTVSADSLTKTTWTIATTAVTTTTDNTSKSVTSNNTITKNSDGNSGQ